MSIGDNERYVLYSKEHGRTPLEMMDIDKLRYPGAVMTGYTLWIADRIREYKKIDPEAFVFDALYDQQGFTEYLKEVVNKQEPVSSDHYCPYCGHVIDNVHTETTDKNVCDKILELESKLIELEKELDDKKRSDMERFERLKRPGTDFYGRGK